MGKRLLGNLLIRQILPIQAEEHVEVLKHCIKKEGGEEVPSNKDVTSLGEPFLLAVLSVGKATLLTHAIPDEFSVVQCTPLDF